MEGSIYITGEIGSFDDVKGVGLIDIIQQVKKYPGATSFGVYINSPGGEVEAGFDIHNYIRSLGVPIRTIGSGMVASIATVIFMAGDERILRQGCEFMIHLPSGGIQGTAEEIAQYSKEVEAVEKRLVDFYKKTIHVSDEAIRPLLKNETFLTNEQALTMGFATQADVAIAAKAKLFINPNTNPMNISEKDKSFFQNLFAGFEKTIKGLGAKVVSLALTAADGTTILTFADVADDAVPVKGDIATIDGKPATGSVLMPDGSTYVFNADGSGALDEITPKVDEQAATVEQLTEQLATATAALETANATIASQTTAIEKVKTDFTALKTKITSSWKPEKKEKVETNDDGKPATRSLLKKKD